jgi:hypothetical protein
VQGATRRTNVSNVASPASPRAKHESLSQRKMQSASSKGRRSSSFESINSMRSPMNTSPYVQIFPPMSPPMVKDSSWFPQPASSMHSSTANTTGSTQPELATSIPCGHTFKALSQASLNELYDRRSVLPRLESVPFLIRDDTSHSRRSDYSEHTPSESWSQLPYLTMLDAPKKTQNRILPLPTASILPPDDHTRSRYSSLPDQAVPDRPASVQGHEHKFNRLYLHRLPLHSPTPHHQTNENQTIHLSRDPSSGNLSYIARPREVPPLTSPMSPSSNRHETRNKTSLATLLQASRSR